MDVKYFTLEEANRTLPLVRRIVADIRTDYQRWRDLLGEYELENGRNDGEWGATEEAEVLRRRIEDVSKTMDAYLAELHQVGCLFKGFPEGTVDFYGRLDGQDIFWCWTFDEPEISKWHGLEAGFAERQPVPEGVR